MTITEFDLQSEWRPLGRFGYISTQLDEGDDFLSAVIEFKHLEKCGDIPDDGFPFPKIVGAFIGNIIGLEFVPDERIKSCAYDFYGKTYSDGSIIYKPAPNQHR
ncbi:MAG: hypothetical protein M3Q79_03445 [bacterium]|nr:hypothetical protein [bacterium]